MNVMIMVFVESIVKSQSTSQTFHSSENVCVSLMLQYPIIM